MDLFLLLVNLNRTTAAPAPGPPVKRNARESADNRLFGTKSCYTRDAFDCPAFRQRHPAPYSSLSNGKEIRVKNIFVGNLDSGTTADSLRELFAAHGAVKRVKLMTDRKTGLSRGFAFVEMSDSEAPPAIAALHGNTVDGRAVDVHEGRPKVHGAARPSA
jgi:hypothetical protein